MIKLVNAEKHYKQFDLNCSLEVRPGQITGLIGENGAGKSTTFKLILDLIHADGGEIEVFGKPASELTRDDKANIGVVLSDSGFSGYVTVKDILPVLSALYKKFDKDAFLKGCEKYRIPLNKKIKDFSTGMKTKLKLLVAIMHEAKLLVLDEPTAGLDVIVRDEFLEMLQDYMSKGERSILISSHISSDLENLCDDFYMIHDGKIIMHEETDILLSEYGILKPTAEQYQTLDKKYLLKVKKEAFGYRCLTNERQYYMENYPDVVIEKGNIDEMILIMVKGERE
ncbi:MAG: ABC transporter ATP-binding protein [Tyzzerella sp.]|nr:ABC transporter ATP-binding protein [Tyzzerella sp.]